MRPSAAFTASKSAAEVKPLASMLPMALWCASAAAFSALPSAAAPMTIALSTAFKASFAETPGRGFRKVSDASESFLAAAPMLSPEGADAAGPGEDTWFFFTTSLKARKAEYAFSASAPFTVDFRYAGTPESVMDETEL